jgi:hypothetical protein
MKKVFNRIYGDYLMPSRLGHYEALLQNAADAGFRQQSMRAFLSQPPGEADPRSLVHRHDIDSDLRTTAKLFALEAKHGITASYYFRLSTLDFGLMREIEAYGSEASYHFEEVAAFAKRHHIKDARVLRSRFPLIRSQFRRNLMTIEGKLGRKLVTVASHGDFANRRLKVVNQEILADAPFRARCGIAHETYDDAVMRRFDMYISDRPHPVYFHPIAIGEALGRYRAIYLLTHPVQWETNWCESTRCNVRRLLEGLTW